VSFGETEIVEQAGKKEYFRIEVVLVGAPN
jgi:hypothetical protein